MRIDVLTLFPEMFAGVLDASILRRAAADVPDPAAPDDPSRVRKAVASYHLHNIRDHSADDKHAKVDSPPYGGGPGMVLQCQPVWDAVQAATAQDPRPPRRLVTTPQGQPLTQGLCEALAAEPRLMILAGHYEGFDQRVLDRLRDDEASGGGGGGLLEISVGDYVLSGGELPAMTIIDAVVRLLPGALGHADSAHEDSFSPGVERLLDHPHYTRPPEWAGMKVPNVLMSGDHAKIAAWRAEQSRRATRDKRPDLLGGGPGADSSDLLITLRDAGPDDREPVLDLHAAAFPSRAESKLVADLLAGHDVLFSILAESGPEIVGHVLLSAMTHEHGGSVRGLVGLAPLAVAEDFRGRGIARALAREAIRQCRENRVSAVFVLGEPEFYGPLGFQPASEHGFTGDYGDGLEFQVLLLRETKPAPKGHVRYAPAFDPLN